jgi:two-component sensor histidine kinase
VNEAVTNAYKHAFPDGRTGEIGVTLEKVGLDGTGALALTVWDNGIGLPAKGRDGSLGLTLIRRFGEQLGGELTLSGEGHGGTTVTLRLPVSPS